MPNRAAFVSVIMNCYNGTQYLREALDSVLAQTFTDWELVFWDNRSTDDSAAIFKTYMDERFRYFLASEHTPLGRARHLAVEQARGEWIAFLDCDDLWLPTKLEQQVIIIRQEGAELGLVYGRSWMFVDEGGRDTRVAKELRVTEHRGPPQRLVEGNIFPQLLKGNFIYVLTAMVRRSAYWSVGGIDSSLKQAEDFDLWVKICKVFKARAVQEVIGCYRIHASNVSNTQMEDNFHEGLAIVSRYLPLPEATIGIRWQQTHFAACEMRTGAVFKGLRRLLLHGYTTLFCYKLLTSVWRRLRYD